MKIPKYYNKITETNFVIKILISHRSSPRSAWHPVVVSQFFSWIDFPCRKNAQVGPPFHLHHHHFAVRWGFHIHIINKFSNTLFICGINTKPTKNTSDRYYFLDYWRMLILWTDLCSIVSVVDENTTGHKTLNMSFEEKYIFADMCAGYKGELRFTTYFYFIVTKQTIYLFVIDVSRWLQWSNM